MSEPSVGPVFTPDQVVAALVGQSTIVLGGFGEIDAGISHQVPNVPLSLLGDTQAQEAVARRVESFWHRKIWALAALLAVLVLGCGIVLGYVWSGGTASGGADALLWRVVRVQSDGVSVAVAGREMLFPVGSMLPSGEELRHVDPVSQTFTTNAQLVTLKKVLP